MDHQVESITLLDSKCNLKSSMPPPTASRKGPSEALASQCHNVLTDHAIRPLTPDKVHSSSANRDFPVGDVRKKAKEKRPRNCRRQTCDSETIRQLSSDLHSLLSVPMGPRGHSAPPLEKWGSNIATRSHSRHQSMNSSQVKISNWLHGRGGDSDRQGRKKGPPSEPQAKGVHFGEARFVPLNRRRSFSNPRFFWLCGILGTSGPIPCDFVSSPTFLRKSDGRESKLDKPALTPHDQSIRIRQMTIVFAQWDAEIIVSTPATPFPANSSPNNVDAIAVLDVLDCIYLHLSEPLLKDSAEWKSASSHERDLARQSLSRRGGKSMKRLDWLRGDTAFAGLEYQGGATPCRGAGADGGRWMVLFKPGSLLNGGGFRAMQ